MLHPLRACLVFGLSAASLAWAAGSVEPPDFLGEKQPRARMLLLGTFHFDDAGLDAHKPSHGFDALSETRQKEIEQLVDKLAAYRPTVVALEVPAENQTALDKWYGKYVAGEAERDPNEIQQIGFRLAKRLGHERVWAVDAAGRSYFPDMKPEEYETREARLLAGVDPAVVAAEAARDAGFEKLYDWEDGLLNRQTLAEHLLYANHPETLRRHHGHYLVGSFKLGRGEDYFGADVKTAWYNRNLRIFQNLQRITRGPDERLLVVIGAGHVPILRHAALASPDYELVELEQVLRPK
jgi:hypothetical protein